MIMSWHSVGRRNTSRAQVRADPSVAPRRRRTLGIHRLAEPIQDVVSVGHHESVGEGPRLRWLSWVLGGFMDVIRKIEFEVTRKDAEMPKRALNKTHDGKGAFKEP